MVDSGSCFDLINRGDLTEAMQNRVRQGDPVPLATANGAVDARDRVKVNLRNKGGNFDALVLEDTPSVLSLGRLCMEEGYKFVWEPGELPQLVPPKGRAITLSMKDRVPILAAPVLGATGLPFSGQAAPAALPTSYGGSSGSGGPVAAEAPAPPPPPLPPRGELWTKT